jgi:hypothetical protein
VLLSSIALGLLSAPFAVAGDGDVMKVGAGNSAENNETRIIGQNVGTYTTRQSNNKEGDGGAAIYGCRSSLAAEPCLEVDSLRGARAFSFKSKGFEGGRITVLGDVNPRNNRPFTTNATGVATGLNADEVDGKSADDLRAKFALVNGDGTLSNGNGVAKVARLSEGRFQVDFEGTVDGCGYTTAIGSADISGTTGVERLDSDSLIVSTRSLPSGDPGDRPFNVTVNC